MSLLSTATTIIQRLQDAGYEAYFAGGAVRDMLMERTPKDYDIATSATPDQVLALYPKANTIGKHFGVILVKHQKHAFEIATFRTDGSYEDGRRPKQVTFASAKEDAQRRDFTINGMFYNPLTEEIIDFVDGQKDLQAGIIRAIGNPAERFQEDALRLLRAVRFSVKTGFQLEPTTLQALHENASLLAQISVERVQEEFSKILTTSDRRRGIELLVDTGLMRHIIPEVYELIGCEQPPQWHPEGDVYTHTCIAFSLLENNAPVTLCLATLLHDIGKPATYQWDEKDQRIRFNGHDAVGAEMAHTILTRLRYPNSVIEDVVAMVHNHMQFMNVQQMRTAKVKRFLARPTIEQELELHRVDCASSNGFTENYDFLRTKQEEFANEPIIPEPLITGRELITLGFRPGPEFKGILEAVQTEQLEGRLTDAEQALSYVKREFLKG